MTIVTDWGRRFEDIQLFLHLQKGPCSSNRHVSLPCESDPMCGYRNFIRIFAGNPNHVGALPMSGGPIPWWLGPSITFPKTNIAPENRPLEKEKNSYWKPLFLGTMSVSGSVGLQLMDGDSSSQTLNVRNIYPPGNSLCPFPDGSVTIVKG